MSDTSGSSATQIVTNVATQLAAQYGVDPNTLVQIALATMQQESGGNAQAVGDGGTSFGLFQLHEGGELGSLTEQQAFDPTTNATRAISTIAQVLKANPSASPGQVAAMAQRPANEAGYAASVNAIISGGTANISTQDGAVDENSTGTAGGTGTTDLSGDAVPAPPGMGDIPGMVAYIKQYFGADAWLLNLPGAQGQQVATMIETAVAQGRASDTAYIQGQLASSPWFQNTSQAYQTYLQQKASNPGDYSFTVPGSKAAQTLANIKATAATQGVQVSTLEAQQLATYSLEYGWDSQQVNAALGDSVYYLAHPGGKPATTNAGSVITQLQTQAAQYLLPVNDNTLQSWAQNIAAGTQTIDQFDAYLKQNASLKWTGMAPQIQQGYTPDQIVNSLRTDAAQLMEVDPSSINFVTDPLYSKILDYVPPDSKNGVHQIMTQSQMNSYLMGTPQWSTTQNARNSAATLSNQIVQTFGKAPS